MAAWTIPLREARDPHQVGGKAIRLGQLAQHYPVPDGFVIPTATSQAFTSAAHLGPDATEASVLAATIPQSIETAIREALAALGDGPVAARSSAAFEDGATMSFAGIYESVLDVRGADAVLDAVKQVWASAQNVRVRAYGAEGCRVDRMAVLVQRMVAAEAAGVAFTADPVTGSRDTVIVSAVRGVGESLVSGTASAEEWRVEGDALVRTRDRGVLGEAQVRAIADVARRIANDAQAPQDVEWAIAGGEVLVLQARPLTALPDNVRWEVPWGGWIRNFRLGEWIGDPVTPSFESWLLTDIEQAMHGHIKDLFGMAPPEPAHLVLNGWYYYGGMNLAGPNFSDRMKGLLMPFFLVRGLLKNFRAAAAVFPPLAHLGFGWATNEWRNELAPKYRALVADANRTIPDAPLGDLPPWIDRLGAAVGRNFASVIGVAGYAAKKEMPLAQFWRAHLRTVDGSFLELVRSGDAAAPAAHDVQGLDWYHPTLGELAVDAQPPSPQTRARIVAERDGLQTRARAAVSTDALRSQFDALVSAAREAHAVREEQARELTLAWPALRTAMRRIGDHLAARGVLAASDQVFFLTKTEIVGALNGDAKPLAGDADSRHTTWQRQRRLAAPLLVGTLPAMHAKIFKMIDTLVHDDQMPGADELFGLPGSPGIATGRVRVLNSPAAIADLLPGEILVAPVTTPAWTPAFTRVAAIVTDTGSIASHASIVAREYGIPAVVATGHATTRFRDGQLVRVDGGRGVVKLLND